MSELVSYHLDNGVATLTLCHGKVNAISHEVIADFHHALDRAVVAVQGAAHEVRRRNAEPTENLPAALVAEAVARGGPR